MKIPLYKTITFIVTKDCQLACKYCYLVAKNNKERMSFDVAKKAIDYILSSREHFAEKNVNIEFIGGEPCLEIDLIDQITDYFKRETFRLDHPWFSTYRLGFTTNGLNYHSEKVQKYILKNKEHLDVTITIDGTQHKHDLNRIYKNSGKGSYADVVKNMPLYTEQMNRPATKVTISSDDLPYVEESVLHLFSLGIQDVHINCVFEDVWKEGDDIILEEQLIGLADKMVGERLFEKHTCSFFSETIGKPLDPNRNGNWCGTGKMMSIDAAGNFYPCTRFAQYSLRDKKTRIIGNIHDGINKNFLRPFLTLNVKAQNPRECIECPVASGCAWCNGENYDAADTPTIYQRSVALCKMHKARVRANNYYWNKLYRALELEGLNQKEAKKIIRVSSNKETC